MPYLMESSAEGTRLKAKTDRTLVTEELALAGLRRGMRALDAGCASGAVSLAMAETVGPEGSVLGLDLSLPRLREGRAEQSHGGALSFVQGAIERLPLRAQGFDFVVCRLVLEYVKEPLPLVRELVRVTRPGGRLVLIDVDGYGAFHHPLEGARKAAVEVVQQLLLRAGFDSFVGRKLYSFLRSVGFQEIDVHVRPYHLVAGAAPEAVLANWRYKLDTLAPAARKALGPQWDAHAAALLEHLRDPETLTYSALFIASGVRP